MPHRLSLRDLNRATLDRQMLLARRPAGIVETVAHLVGLQGQVSENPYQGLWNRIEGFRHPDLTALIEARQVARATSLRGTLHLHTPADLVALRPLVRPTLLRIWQAAFGRQFGGSDPEAVRAAGAALLDEGPKTAGELGKRLGATFPESTPQSLAIFMQMQEILVQIPPTRVWGSGHAPILARAPNWLGHLKPDPIVPEEIVRRSLRAWGPASVADMQTWSGLTGLRTAFAALGDELVRHEDEDGRTLYDLAGAALADPGQPAPVRFLPDFENALIGYADRRRILPEAFAKGLWGTRSYRSVLVDGFVAATWTIRRTKVAARLEILPFRHLLKREIRAIEAEAGPFLAFMAGETETRDVAFIDA
jgi:hypothetical protein